MTSSLVWQAFCVTLAWLALLSPSARSEDAVAQPSLDVRWSSVLPSRDDQTLRGAAPGFQVRDAALAPDGRLILFGHEAGPPLVAFGVDENGLGPTVRLTLRGSAYTAAVAPDGTLWVGGLANQRAYVPGGDISDAYLAHVDRDGRLLAEHTFGNGWFKGRYRAVQALAVLSSGEVVAVARDGGETWSAKVTAAGALAWETRFGTSKAASVAVLRDDRIAVATIDAAGSRTDRTYAEGVTVRVFDQAGQRLAETNIRQGLNTVSIADYGQLATATVGDAVYVASSWGNPSTPKPIEVAKVGADGAVLWRRLLDDPNTSEQTGSAARRTRRTCEPGLAALPNGDALVACAQGDRITLHRLAAASGEVAHTFLPLPACHESRPAKVFPFVRQDGSLWVLGTRPANNVAASCTWLGRVEHWPPD